MTRYVAEQRAIFAHWHNQDSTTTRLSRCPTKRGVGGRCVIGDMDQAITAQQKFMGDCGSSTGRLSHQLGECLRHSTGRNRTEIFTFVEH